MRVRKKRGPDLREHPEDPQILADAIENRRKRLQIARERWETGSGDEEDLGILGRELDRLGEYLRLARQLGEAEEMLEAALDAWRELGRTKAQFMTRLRLANTRQYQGRHRVAREAYDALLSEARSDANLKVYRPFVLFDRGVGEYHADRPESALRDFEMARELWRKKGVESHVEMCDEAVALATEALKK